MLNAEHEFEIAMQESLLEMSDENGVAEISTFDNAGIMTMNAGLVVRMSNGDEFQVTIVQSVFTEPEDDDEEES
jgi:ABC-type antimicrobial peptide transport system ATPase subunit